MAKELWKPIPSEPGYEASSLGRVRSIDRVVETSTGKRRYRGKILVASSIQSGHQVLALGRFSRRTVHALVLEAFVGFCPPGQECLHRNGVPWQNDLGNLRYGTRSENNFDKSTHGSNKLTVDQVREARAEHASGTTGTVLAARFGVSKSLMYYALKGEYYARV